MDLKANTRMYNLSPAVEAAWSRLLARAARLSGVRLELLDHPPPKPIDALWARPDLGLAMMCGWPFHRARPRPVAIAAPVPDAPEAGGRPIYWTDMVVASGSPARTLEDTFGGTIAWTMEESHSGFNAPRHCLLPSFLERGGPLYGGVLPRVMTPRGAIDAVLSGRADVAPLDGFFHLLLRRHEPETAARLRRVARTAPAPIPLFVASHGTDPGAAEALRRALEALHDDAEGAGTLRELGLRRFVRMDPGAYALGDAWDAEARAAGYDEPS